MANKIAVKVSLYNGIFSVDSMPPGVELFLTDEDSSACDDESYPGGVRRARFHTDVHGCVVERQIRVASRTGGNRGHA